MRPATTKAIGRATSSEAPALVIDLLDDVRGVGAGHDELAVRHVDDAHLAEGQGQAEGDEQQHRADADAR